MNKKADDCRNNILEWLIEENYVEETDIFTLRLTYT